jgi:Tol biopolymer transport system component
MLKGRRLALAVVAVAAAALATTAAAGDSHVLPGQAALVALVREGNQRSCVDTGPPGSSAFHEVIPVFTPSCPVACASSTTGTTCPKPRPDGIYLVGPDGLDPQWLAAGFEPSWSADGTQLAYSTGRGLAIEPVADRQDRDVIAWLPTALADDAGQIGASSWAPDGRSIVFSVFYRNQTLTGDEWREELYSVNTASADVRRVTSAPAGESDHAPAYSPNGHAIAYAHWGAQPGIWLVDPDGTDARQLLPVDGFPGAVAWSPDGGRLAFSLYDIAKGTSEIDVVDADGTGLQRVVMPNDEGILDRPTWSPDGGEIEFTAFDGAGDSRRLYAVRPDGTGLHAVLREPWAVYQAAWRPAGS